MNAHLRVVAVGMLEHLVSDSRCRRALVVGVGGGGDVVSALHVALRLRRLGCRVSLGSVPWERWVVDPSPGPIGLEDLVNAYVAGGFAMADGRTMACRLHGCFYPQASRLAGVLGEPVVLIPIDGGVEGFVEAVKDYTTYSGVDLLIGVDAGGDILARGYEDDLWSPLADQVALAGLYRAMRELGLSVAVGVHGLGCDGELSREELMGILADLASKNGVLGFEGLSRWDEGLLEEALRAVKTEASRLPYEAFRGALGVRSIRRGTRSVRLDLFSAATIMVDVGKLYEASPMARRIAHTSSIWEAKEELNSMGIYTELDLELDIARLRGNPVEIRGMGRRRLSVLRRADIF